MNALKRKKVMKINTVLDLTHVPMCFFPKLFGLSHLITKLRGAVLK